MKPKVLFVLTVFLSLTLQAQIDNSNNSFSIPAVETDKDSTDATPLTPSKPIANNEAFKLNTPETNPNLEMPKKQFSMFPEEEFANPGEIYNKRLKSLQNEVLPEGHGDYAGLKEDAYWGDYRTTSEYVIIQYRDSGREDGDFLGVLLDDDFIRPRELLTNNFRGFKIKLKEGLNKIDFLALNEGDFLPNTAQYRITDDKNQVIAGRVWGLSTGVKVTVIIIKE